MVITIDKNNQVYINDYKVTLNFLREKLIKILDGRVSQAVYLKADKNISYGMVARVMSEIKGAGVEVTPVIEQKFPEIEKLVLKELKRWGVSQISKEAINS